MTSSIKNHIGFQFELLGQHSPLSTACATNILIDASALLSQSLKSLDFWPHLKLDGDIGGAPYTFMGPLGLPPDHSEELAMHSLWFDSPVDIPIDHLRQIRVLLVAAVAEACNKEHASVRHGAIVQAQERREITHLVLSLG